MDSNETEAWLKFYDDNGIMFFPLFGITNGVCRCPEAGACKNTGKHPRVKWKGFPSQKPGSLDNLGISTDNLVVVDIDGDVGEDALSAYPGTFTTSTGHGYHLWYRADPSKAVKTCVAWRPKVDVRAVGGLLVVPPSRHYGGGTYHHLRGDSIRPVPRYLLDELPEKSTFERRIGRDVVVKIADTPAVMAPLGRKLVEEMEAAACAEGSRNQTLFRLACRYFELAANDMMGVDFLKALAEAARGTGLTDQEVMRTLDSARKSV